MKLIYISPLRYPSEKAGSLFSMKSCEAFAGEGLAVELWVPRRRNYVRHDPFEYHGIKQNFRLVYLPVVDLSPLPFFYFPLALSFAVSVLVYALIRRIPRAIYYSHEEFALFLLTFLSGRTVYEVHDFPGKSALFRRLFRRLDFVVLNNQWKVPKIRQRFSFPSERMLAIPNGVDLAQFSIPLSKGDARQKLGLSSDGKVIVYTGSLFGWKGVGTLVEAARVFPKGVAVYCVGGGEKDSAEFRQKYADIHGLHLMGQRPHVEIPLWLRAADVLVLPNTAREDISKYYTSPMKLFEYMASERPIIASDLPSVRQIVDDSMVWFFKPDDALALANAITHSLARTDESVKKSSLARLAVVQYSWERRAKTVIDFLRTTFES